MDEEYRKHGVEITKNMDYRTRSKACETMLGNHKEQYRRIRDYSYCT